MSAVILDNVPLRLGFGSLSKRLHVDGLGSSGDELRRLVQQAQRIARPKAMYRAGYIESRDADSVVVDGVLLSSRVLRVNLERAQRVFVYLATCGTEVQDWARSLDDVLQQYWAEAVQEAALHAATRALNRELVERYGLGKASTMAPGSLADWPLSQQRTVFELLGDTRAAIGVQLSESLLMIPIKSVSGIRFATEESFESCQLCPRTECPGRRAPHDGTLYDKKYRLRRTEQG